MDYRELENRLERNRSMIKERDYDCLVKQVKQANRAGQRPFVAPFKTWIVSLIRRVPQARPQPVAKPVVNLSRTNSTYPGKG